MILYEWLRIWAVCECHTHHSYKINWVLVSDAEASVQPGQWPWRPPVPSAQQAHGRGDEECAVTVAWGTRDRILWPRQARKAAELLPRARHAWLHRCGHVPMIDEPELVVSLILETCAAASAAEAA